jgi:hypothetical protein
VCTTVLTAIVDLLLDQMLEATNRLDDFRDVDRHSSGDMNVSCSHCGAFRWKSEKASLCCHNGKVDKILFPSLVPHGDLADLFNGSGRESKEFLAKIRKYNLSFAFTSMGSKLDTNLASDRNGVYTFRVNGEMYHRIGSFDAEPGQPARFCQIYFLDPDSQVDRRLGIFDDLNANVAALIHRTMQSANALVHQFEHARTVAGDCANIRLAISGSAPAGEHPRRFNRPTAPEIAAVLLDDQHAYPRDIVLRRRGGGLDRINECHPAYNALSYPLFFPEGRHGWSLELKSSTGVTLKSYIQFSLQKRSEPNVLHLGGKLFQQFVVDQYLRVERQNLMFVRTNQRQLRAECYQGLVDAMHNDSAEQIGKCVVRRSLCWNLMSFF